MITSNKIPYQLNKSAVSPERLQICFVTSLQTFDAETKPMKTFVGEYTIPGYMFLCKLLNPDGKKNKKCPQ